ncbi:MAG: polyprenyl synthetase family protein [bacterium]
MLPFHNAAKEDFQAVNQLIIDQLHSDVPMVENIGHYIIDAGGKRLRPLVVLLAAKALSYEGTRHVELAAVIEFIHTATLLHDDVVDTSELRRGRSTANAKFGNAPSVLVGDFLYSRAFQMLVAIDSLPIMKIIADATNVISEGEVQQLINAGNPDTTEDQYYETIRKKTAQLFEAATEVGATIATSDQTAITALKTYGNHLGMAFQLMDDALDYQGSTEELGKNVGDDLAEGKPTLPLIYGMRHGGKDEAAVIRNAISSSSADNLEKIVAIIRASGGLDYTLKKAGEHRDAAIRCLEPLNPSPYKEALAAIADFSVERRV